MAYFMYSETVFWVKNSLIPFGNIKKEPYTSFLSEAIFKAHVSI